MSLWMSLRFPPLFSNISNTNLCVNILTIWWNYIYQLYAGCFDRIFYGTHVSETIRQDTHSTKHRHNTYT